MTPLSEAHTEVRLLVDRVVDQAAQLRAQSAGQTRWHTHRRVALSQLLHTLERVEPGLGVRYACALYPNLTELHAQAMCAEGLCASALTPPVPRDPSTAGAA